MKKDKTFVSKFCAVGLSLCMGLSLIPMASLAAGEVVTYQGEDCYTRFGGSVLGKTTVKLANDWYGIGASTDKVSIANPSKMDPIATNTFAGLAGDATVTVIKPSLVTVTWGSIEEGLHEYPLYALMKNVTGDPGLTLTVLSDTSTEHFKVNGSGSQIVTPSMTVAGGPTVHLVYDVDAVAVGSGKIEYAAGRFLDPNVDDDYSDLLAYWKSTGLATADARTEATKEGNTVMDKAATAANHTGANAVTAAKPAETVQWGAGEALTFTVTPDAHYRVKSVTSTLGTLTDNKDGTYTLNVPETAITNASAKATVTATFSGEDTTITSSVDAASPANSGTINPLGTQTVEYGTNQAFTITPTSGYCVDTVAVTENGNTTTYATTDAAIYNSTAKTWGYTFEKVAQAGTISVKFAVDANGDLIPDNQQVVLTFTAGDNGSFTSSSIPSDATGTDKTASYTIVRNKTDGAGKISETGNYTIVAADVATPMADTGYAFDLWKQGSTDLGVTDKTAPVGKVVDSSTTFTASFATGGHVDPDIPAKYELAFKFTLDANSAFDGPSSTEITKYAVKYDGNHVPALDGIATLRENLVPVAKGKVGYNFVGWTSASFTGTKQTADLDGMTFTGTTVTIQANSENAAAVLKVLEDSDVALGQWKDDTSFTYTVQMRLGDDPAPETAIRAVTVNAGELYRERTSDFPGVVDSYMTLNAPVFTDFKESVLNEDDGLYYAQITMTLSKKDAFKSAIVTFTASYDDGVANSENNNDSFVAIVPGDANRNGVVNAADGLVIYKKAGGAAVAEGTLTYADEIMEMNGNGVVNAADGLIVYQMAGGKTPAN